MSSPFADLSQQVHAFSSYNSSRLYQDVSGAYEASVGSSANVHSNQLQPHYHHQQN